MRAATPCTSLRCRGASEGENKQDALRNIKEAIELYLDIDARKPRSKVAKDTLIEVTV